MELSTNSLGKTAQSKADYVPLNRIRTFRLHYLYHISSENVNKIFVVIFHNCRFFPKNIV
jgi:hypothetical protein